MRALGLLARRVAATTSGAALLATAGLATPALAASTPCTAGGTGATGANGVVVCWQDDPNRVGDVTFYDATGHVKTSGNVNDKPFASYYAASGGVITSGDNSASVQFTTPEKANSLTWSGTQQWSSDQSQPAATGSLPGDLAGSTKVVVKDDSGQSFKTAQIDAFPNNLTDAGYQNLYEVRIVTSPATGGTKFYSADIQVDPSTGAWTQVYPVPAVAATAPDAPTALSATAGYQRAVLSWTAPAYDGGSALTGYDVTYTPAGGTPTTVTTPGTGTTYTLTGLVNGTSYDVTVAARNAVGTGPATAPQTVVPANTVPGAPTGVTAVAKDGAAVVSFTAPADSGDGTALSYTVTASTGQTATGSASPLTVTGLANGTSRTFTVTATNTVGTGAASAASNAVVYYSSSLTLRASTGVVVAGSPVKLYGQLTSGPATARRLVLYMYPAGKPASTYAFSTTSTGAWSLYAKPLFNTTYKVVYAGDATHKAVTSASVKVYARTKVTITSPRTGTRTTTRTLAVTGTTSPNKAGTVVNLYEIRSTGNVLLARVTVASNGTFRFVRTFAKGTHVLQVTIGNTATNAAGSSNRVTLYEV